MMIRSLRPLLHDPHGPWFWVIGPAFLAALPHFGRLPLWIGMACIGLWVLRLSAEQYPRWMPSKPARFALTAGCIAGVHASFGHLLGPEPGTALLLLLLALKPFENQGRRDQVLILFMAYLLILLQFLNSQSLPVAGYMILVVLVTTAALLGIVHPASQSNPGFRLRQAGLLLLQALPVMLLLFVLFPRLPGSLWGMFHEPRVGLTGLSETISPGDISELLQSSEVVFRVTFAQQPPPVGRMYWRALVLQETDGRTWRTGKPQPEPQTWWVRPLGLPVEYVLTMEAHHQRWLPVLEMPVMTGRDHAVALPGSDGTGTLHQHAVPAPDFRLTAPEDLRRRAQFHLLAALNFTTSRPAHQELQLALDLPPTGNDRARALALDLAAKAPNQRGIVEQALELFQSEPFAYTLRPPLLGEQAVDDFLFRTRSGYCEHYASAFTFLMRAAGIPARVVVGYQGGDRNPLGDYFVVRQYHAHAWSEVWLEETGWKRVDPTTVLAPERIDRGAGALVPNIDVPGMLSSREMGWLISAWRGLTQGWDAANTLWNQWVLDFGFERQRRFLEHFGLTGTSRLERLGQLVLALSLSLLGAALVYGLVLLWTRPSRDPVDKAYNLFCRRLGRVGIRRALQEGPRDFALRAIRQRPDLASAITPITDGYIRLRYGTAKSINQGESADGIRLAELTRMIRSFRPDPISSTVPDGETRDEMQTGEGSR